MPESRLAEAADLALVEAITNEAYTPYIATLGQKPLPMTEDYAPRIAAGGVRIIRHDDVDAGVLVTEPEDGNLLIFSVAIRPGLQRAGLGRWMLDHAEDLARQAGMPEIRLYTGGGMTRNIGIYKQAGYIELGRRPNPYRPGWILVDMAKRLA